MNFLIPFSKNPIPKTEVSIKHYSLGTHYLNMFEIKPFLFKTTHGYASLGFILNGYGFISPENLEQIEIPKLDLGFEYKWEFLKNSTGEYTQTFKDYRGEVRYKTKEEIAEEIIRNLSKFKLIYAQSQKPITQKELETKKNIEKISKLNLFNSSGHRIYVSQLNYRYDNNYSYDDYLRYGDVEDYKRELKRRVKFIFRKGFTPGSLNPFESLELLTSKLMPLIFTSDFSKTDSYYGSIHEFTTNSQNAKSQNLTSRLISR